MMNLTTTETSVLAMLTSKTRAAYEEALRIRKRDYDGVVPRDVAELRKLKEKVEEHDGDLSAIKRGIMNIAGMFGKKR